MFIVKIKRPKTANEGNFKIKFRRVYEDEGKLKKVTTVGHFLQLSSLHNS